MKGLLGVPGVRNAILRGCRVRGLPGAPEVEVQGEGIPAQGGGVGRGLGYRGHIPDPEAKGLILRTVFSKETRVGLSRDQGVPDCRSAPPGGGLNHRNPCHVLG